MQQFSVFQTTHVSHGTPPLGELTVFGYWKVEFFRTGVPP